MKGIKFIAIIFIVALSFVSCQNEDVDLDKAAVEEYPKISSKLKKMYFNTNDLELVEVPLPDGSIVEMFKVEGDILLSREQINAMRMGSGIDSKQYRATNTVYVDFIEEESNPNMIRNISVYGYTGNNRYGLNATERLGLTRAIADLNALHLELRFQLNFGVNYQSSDIAIYHNNPTGSAYGGRANFPSRGNPGNRIQVWGLTNSTRAEQIIKHELGHTIGLRHTDWNTGRSCHPDDSDADNTESNSLGAIHIPGTPWGYDSTSLMLRCDTGNLVFNVNDRSALYFMY